MTASDCPRPLRCPVPDPPSRLPSRGCRAAIWRAGRPFFRVYDTRFGRDEFNPGHGDTRFAPLIDGGRATGSMYGADTEVATLLETVFHDVGFGGVIFERSLVDRGLVMLSSLVDLPLLDLRDDRLPALGLTRGQLVTTPAEHHACTREWVRLFREVSLAGVTPAGLLWHSRQADLAGGQPADVFMLFGDRAPSTRGAYRVHHPGVTNLVSGAGRVHIEQITEWLDVVIEPVS